MTQKQIAYVLADLESQFGIGSYVEDVWLEMDEVSGIILLTDEIIYPDNTMHIFFDSGNEIMKLGKGHYDENDAFIVDHVEAVVMYEHISGFNMARATRMKSPYMVSATV